MASIVIGSLILLSLLSGCAHLDFGGEGLTYYDPQPYLLVTIAKDCKVTAAPLVLPGDRRAVKFVPGYGSAKLSVSLANGMITQAGQDTDTQVPATITALSGLGTAVAGLAKERQEKPTECPVKALLYPITSGVPDLKNPVVIVIE